MGVVASVSSTFSFGLVAGAFTILVHRQFSRTALFAGGHVGLVFGWLIPCFFVLAIAASLAELTSAMPCVLAHLFAYPVSYFSNTQDERWAVLFLSKTCTPALRPDCELDHRLGEHNWPGDISLLH